MTPLWTLVVATKHDRKLSELRLALEPLPVRILALGGRPGVMTTRFAHERATDAENNAAVLREMEPIEEGERSARYRTVLAVALPWLEDAVLAEGIVVGVIARTARGGGGFGYEPLFIVDGQDGRTLAELNDVDKSRYSSRQQAARAAVLRLQQLLTESLQQVDRIIGGT